MSTSGRLATAGVILLGEREGKLSVALVRSHEAEPALPTGPVLSGDSLQQAAQRVLREETGLDARLVTYLGPMARRSGGGFATVFMFLAFAVSTNNPDTRVEWLAPKRMLEAIPSEDERAFLRERLSPLLRSDE